MQNDKEKALYQGGPSQVINFSTFAICGVMFLVAILAPSLWNKIFINYYPQNKSTYMAISKFMFFLPVFWAPYAWLKVRSHKYKITTERFIETSGILSRTTNEMELFRIKDITFLEPFLLRLIGCGHIVMDTSDRSSPVVVLRSIKNARPVMEVLRKNVGIMREKKGVREVEM